MAYATLVWRLMSA